MVKPLSFKGDKKPKKRKRAAADPEDQAGAAAAGGELATTQDPSAAAAAENDPENDDSWVSAEAATDVVGPIVIVLPTDTPSALACDAIGKVFAIPIENMVENNPSTAEPHDVRQVWVAHRISGTEQFRFKGHHGRFLACDKNGTLSATSEAVSPLESFNIIPTASSPGTFQIQTMRDTYITLKPAAKSGGDDGVAASASASKSKTPGGKDEIKGDAESVSFNTTLRIRMQARFKPRIKASKEEKAREKVSRKELEQAVGRRLEEDEVRKLKRARREGDYHEQLLMIKVKGKHDKYA